MPRLIDYDFYKENFTQSLISKLRKHGSEEESLQFWVPDERIEIGLMGMIDSVALSGEDQFTIIINKETITLTELRKVKEKLEGTFQIEVEEVVNKWSLDVVVTGKSGNEKSSQRLANITPHKNTLVTEKKINDRGGLTTRSNPISSLLEKYLKTTDDIEDYQEGEDIIGEFVSASDQGVTIYARIQTSGIVEKVRYRYSGSNDFTDKLINLFCHKFEPVPVKEFCEHQVVKFVNYLVNEGALLQPEGITLPTNSGDIFVTLSKILHNLGYIATRENLVGDDVNLYFSPPSISWVNLSNDQRYENINRALDVYYRSSGLKLDNILDRVVISKNKYGYPCRVILIYKLPTSVDRSKDLFSAEQFLRKNVEKTLELLMDRVKDTSPLRRLT